MVTNLSVKISYFFIRNSIIKEEESEVYAYCIEVLLSAILNLICLMIIAFLTGTFFESTAFILGLIPMRTIAGGYHAKNHFNCLSMMIMVYSSFLVSLFFINSNLFGLLSIILMALSTILIFAFAPVDDINKRFTDNQRERLKVKSRILICIYIVSIIIMLIFSFNSRLIFSLAYGVFFASLSLFWGFIKNKNIKLKGE